jgi:hypothetical protein
MNIFSVGYIKLTNSVKVSVFFFIVPMLSPSKFTSS